MKREEQIKINEVVKAFYNGNDFTRAIYGIEKLYNCSAVTFHTDIYIVLKSYNTIIAVIDTNSDTCYDFLRLVYGYTATSAQHISKFMKKYGITRKLTYKDI